MSNIEAALTYLRKGYSLLPVQKNKKPFIEWAEYQKRLPTEKEITDWWQKWPNANIGIVTGSVSGIVVVDVDEACGFEELEKYIPDSLICPTASTARGGRHYYFKAPEQPIPGNVRGLPGIDLRAEGNFIMAPPSVYHEGTVHGVWEWLPDLSLLNTHLPCLPDSLLAYYNNKSLLNNIYKNRNNHANQKLFLQGSRDNDIFHVANCLVKGGMTHDNITQVLEILANNCQPPFPEKEIPLKIESAIKRSERREHTLSDEVLEYALSTTGNFMSTDVYNCLQLSTRDEKKNVSIILKRLCEKRIIERYGNKNGHFRRVENDMEAIDIIDEIPKGIDIKLPFNLHKLVKLLPKNIIVFAGASDAGKTAWLLNIVKDNIDKFKIKYFSSEMGAIELASRLQGFEDLDKRKLKGVFWERSCDFQDVIDPDGINIIDFLEIHDEFYKVGAIIKLIFDKLKNGLCFIALQKNPGTEYGLGGARSIEKARLYVSIDPNKAKIIKAKNWINSQYNPNGLQIEFKTVSGCNLYPVSTDWYRPLK